MFIRVDTDLFVRVENISSYRILESNDSYKLQIWSSGILVHNIIYLKGNPNNIKLLIEFVEAMKDYTVNPDIVIPQEPSKHIEERIDLGDENND